MKPVRQSAFLISLALATASESASGPVCEGEKGPMPESLKKGISESGCECIMPALTNTSQQASVQGIEEATYGKGECLAWDNNTLDCGGVGCASVNSQDSCYSAWCYVDPYRCTLDWSWSFMFPSSGRAYSYAACGELNKYDSYVAGKAALDALRGKALRVSYRSSTGGWRGAYHVNGKSRLTPTPSTGWFGPLAELFDQIRVEYKTSH